MDRPAHRRARIGTTLALLALVSGAVGTAGRAAGQPDDNPASARAQFDAGVEALEADQFERAAGLFRRAAEAFGQQGERSARTAATCNLALTYDRWDGHGREALDAYRRCARYDETGRYRDYASRRATELQQQLGAAAPSESAEPAAAAAESPSHSGAGPPRARAGAPGAAPGPAPARDPGPEARAATTEAGSGQEATVIGGSRAASGTTREGTAPTQRGRGLLWAGLASAVAAAGTLTGGALLARGARDDHAELERCYPGDEQVRLPADSRKARLLDDAQRKSNAALGLYVVGGVLGALSVTLVSLDLLLPRAGGDDGAQVEMRVHPAGASLHGSF